MASFAFEKHYRVKELAGIWGLSPKTVTRLFEDEPGVIRVANEVTGKPLGRPGANRNGAYGRISASATNRSSRRLRVPIHFA